MWITKDVNLPQHLIDAQRNGSLVIFVGAGVSMLPPSSLPDFKQLAIQVAGGTLTLAEGEPIDRFLGKLKDQGIQVHARVRDIISSPESKPSQLHNAIVSLFSSANEIRIVTTNFDRHFATVAQERFGNGVEIYYAPALPLGRKFTGIVYLHGGVEKKAYQLVLTDTNFGRAYLTDGWARRFLQDMFAKYTVLFVGYSHNDPVMNYLARGLPPQTFRYALTTSELEEHWKHSGISPIIYPLKNGPNDHGALIETVQAWVKHIQMGALEQEQRIRQIVSVPPPLEPDDADYIKSTLDEVSTVRFFTRHAKTPEWLRWAEDKTAFRELFRLNEKVNVISQELASWFAKQFIFEHPEEALAIVQRHGPVLNTELSLAIARHLAFPNPRPNPEILRRWVAVLLRSPQPEHQGNLLDYVLYGCCYPDDNVTALLLFEYLTRPHIELKPYLRFLNREDEKHRQIDAEIIFKANELFLKESWQKVFHPYLADFFKKLAPILTNHITQTHLLLQAFGKTSVKWDSLNLRRPAIESTPQNRNHGVLDVLIDGARDVIESMLQHQPATAHAVIETWSDSDVLLLKRLAIHGMAESLQIGADRKIAWVLEKDWLFAHGMSHEIFRLLKNSYPNTGETIRNQLLEYIKLVEIGKASKHIETEDRAYEVYNLLYWLHQASPDCPLTTNAFNTIQEKHPDFMPSSCPDFREAVIFSTEWYRRPSPITIEELLTKDPTDETVITWILNNKSDSTGSPDFEGLLNTISVAVTQSFEWSSKLAVSLKDKEAWNTEVWRSILRGWNNGSLKESQWLEALTLLSEHKKLYQFANPIADLLENGIRKNQDSVPSSCLELAEQVADQLWDTVIQERPENEPDDFDWLTRAINRSGGKLVAFWIHALARRRSELGKNWASLSEQYKQRLNKVISGNSYAAELGRVLLTSQIHFLFALEPNWTRQNILPLLDWSIDKKRAQQAWHGYLLWGRGNEALLPDLIRLYELTFLEISKEPSDKRDLFCEHLASIAVYSSSDPIKEGWLEKFLKAVGAYDRKNWASHVHKQLRSLPENSAQDLWDRWMNEYWLQRISGIPLPLGQDEIEEMIEWAPHLGTAFPMVVQRICASPPPQLKQTYLYTELRDKKIATSHPESVTQLLRHLLPNAHQPFLHCNEVEELVRCLVGSAASRPKLILVCDDLARLGCFNAAELMNLVNENKT